MTVLVESALIAHPDRVLVVVPGMCPRQILMTSLVHLSITSDVVVVTSESKSSLVAGNQRRNRKVPILTGWKIQSELTPRANVSLTPENFFILTP